jgi:hypothetical protein
MRGLVNWLSGRLLPAVLTAAGVAVLAAGLLSFQDPPEVAATVPGAPLTPIVAPTPSLIPLPTLAPPGAEAPTVPAPADRVATRIVIPALRIDLPIVRPPDEPDHFPFCDVAEFITQLSQPGLPGATYIYAHAREGMFLPLLVTADARLLGVLVQVYTNDNLVFLYEITEVLRSQTTLDAAFDAVEEQLWLQTSEGPRGTVGKTQIVALPISQGPADPAFANPTPRPRICY